MQCRNVEVRIHELLDDRVDPWSDVELAEHADECPECRDLLAAHRKLADGLLLLDVPSLTPDFSQRVVGTVVLRRNPGRRFAPVGVFLALVATLLIVVSIGPRHRLGSVHNENTVANASLGPTYGGTFISMADIDSPEFRLLFKQFFEQWTNGDGTGFYQVDQLAGTIRPLASTLNVAFDAIRRSIPGQRPPTRTEPQAREVQSQWAQRII